MNIDWDKLIEEHYLSACKINPEYDKKYSREEMKNWFYSLINKGRKKDVLMFLEGSTHANNNGYVYHPV